MDAPSPIIIAGVLMLMAAWAGSAAQPPASATKRVPGWPEGVEAITYTSRADHSRQPCLFYDPGQAGPVPLLVALHTWSNDYLQSQPFYAQWCIKNRWAMVHPHFRGPNRTPQACGSDLAVQDIRDAVAYALQHVKIDTNRIYLVGVSGGGHDIVPNVALAWLAAQRKGQPAVWNPGPVSQGAIDLREEQGAPVESGK